MSFAAFGAFILKYTAAAIGGPAAVAEYVALAMLDTARLLFDLLLCHHVEDIGRMRDAFIERIEARTEAKVAEARKRMAEAAKASSEATRARTPSLIERAEARLKNAEAAKVRAEAKAALMKAEAEARAAQAEARARLIDALSKLRQEGGDILVSALQLRELLGEESVAPDEQEVSPPRPIDRELLRRWLKSDPHKAPAPEPVAETVVLKPDIQHTGGAETAQQT